MHPVNQVSFRHKVAEQLRAAIASGELVEGERLNEVAVAKQLGVSTTPVREAFRDLEQMGLIEVTPYRGVRVRALTPQDLAEIYSLRSHLEELGIKFAYPLLTESDYDELADLIRAMEDCANKDDPTGVVEHDVAFHRLIMVRTGHALLLKTWEQIHPSRWTYVTVRVLSARGPLYIAQRHWPLLEALRGPSLDEAIAVASDHISLVGDEALRALDQHDDKPVDEAEANRADTRR